METASFTLQQFGLQKKTKRSRRFPTRASDQLTPLQRRVQAPEECADAKNRQSTRNTVMQDVACPSSGVPFQPPLLEKEKVRLSYAPHPLPRDIVEIASALGFFIVQHT